MVVMPPVIFHEKFLPPTSDIYPNSSLLYMLDAPLSLGHYLISLVDVGVFVSASSPKSIIKYKLK